MVAKVEDRSTQTQVAECQCREQIADILLRLETLEREALTLQRLREIEPASITQTIADHLSR
jgi:hypothetical protein